MLERSRGFSPSRVPAVDRNNYCYHVYISNKTSIALTGTHYRVHLRKSLRYHLLDYSGLTPTASANRAKSTNKPRTDTLLSFLSFHFFLYLFSSRLRVETTANQRRKPFTNDQTENRA